MESQINWRFCWKDLLISQECPDSLLEIVQTQSFQSFVAIGWSLFWIFGFISDYSFQVTFLQKRSAPIKEVKLNVVSGKGNTHGTYFEHHETINDWILIDKEVGNSTFQSETIVQQPCTPGVLHLHLKERDAVWTGKNERERRPRLTIAERYKSWWADFVVITIDALLDTSLRVFGVVCGNSNGMAEGFESWELHLTFLCCRKMRATLMLSFVASKAAWKKILKQMQQ